MESRAPAGGLVPGKVQKISVADDVIVIELFAGTKCFLVFHPGRVEVVTEKPAVNLVGPPPAVQGLLRKEMQPSILTAIVDDRHVFARKDLPPCSIVVEKDGKDPRWLLLTPAKDQDKDPGERILATGPATRATDGRDLRRGRIYEPPRRAPTAMPDPTLARATPETKDPTTTATSLLSSRLKVEIDRKRRLLKALAGDLKKHGDPAALEEDGELLKTVMGTLKRGAASVDVTGFDGAVRTLVLDPTKDARQNLQAFFARAKRGKTGREHARPRIEAAQAMLTALEAARVVVNDAAASAAQLAEVEALLARGGPAPRRKAAMQTAKKEGGRRAWRAFQIGTTTIRVGRGARDNDSLVKASNGNDLWLHTRDATGAHVVIPSNGGVIEDELLRDAALLAAWFSTLRGERNVMVQHTRVKNLKKPGAGAPAGLWIVGQETVFSLRVDDERTKKLLQSEVAA